MSYELGESSLCRKTELANVLANTFSHTLDKNIVANVQEQNISIGNLFLNSNL